MAMRLRHPGFKLPTRRSTSFSRSRRSVTRKNSCRRDLGLVDGPIRRCLRLGMEYLTSPAAITLFPLPLCVEEGRHRPIKKRNPAEEPAWAMAPGDARLRRSTAYRDVRASEGLRYPRCVAGQGRAGRSSVKVNFGDGDLVTGKGASTDIIEGAPRHTPTP
ncbi:MAG: hypothetical protein Ct9H300mP7_4190 [Verrucomicrobiota bacterium]|nr:MAG: hypothetical protein Ct9H300mP7_4190 [Verrucomicrobiota bacterium]